MASVVLYDCEFLTAPGAPMRFWCGPHDPDPLCIQIGAVRLELDPPFAVSPPVLWYVQPVDRDNRIAPVDPLVTHLLGITDQMLAEQALPLVDALGKLANFAGDDTLYSWGRMIC